MKVAIVDPALGTRNGGDAVISRGIHHALKPITGMADEVRRLALHRAPSREERDFLGASDEVLICGTNLMSNYMALRRRWPWSTDDLMQAAGRVTFFGVGWWQYQTGAIDPWSSRLLKRLQGNHAWATRDDYSAKRLREAGLRATNLGCPTMWEMGSQVLPRAGSRVVATITDYNQNPTLDRALLRLLQSSYRNISIWPQGQGDLEYIRRDLSTTVDVLDPSLTAFENALKMPGTNYVGLRLHGGIFAMQLGVPALVVAIDNRTVEIAKSSGMYAPSRFDLPEIEAVLRGEEREVILRDLTSERELWLARWTRRER